MTTPPTTLSRLKIHPRVARALIVGFGDIGFRVAAMLSQEKEIAVDALIRNLDAEKKSRAMRAGTHGNVRACEGDLSNAASMAEFQGIAHTAAYDTVFHFAPPPNSGNADTHTEHLLSTLPASVKRLIYISTTGVYGDCGGASIDESQALQPATDRAKRRVAAETTLRTWCAARDVVLTILRAPGIYAEDRLPIERLRAQTPALRDEDDVFTNHIHAHDLANSAIHAVFQASTDVFNIVDDSDMKMGAYFDLVADHLGVPRAPRISRDDAARVISPAMLSFMRESRRIQNEKMKRLLIAPGETTFRLRYPSVADFLAEKFPRKT
jgi:nucleoside-diphosphate-sugar epimerase